MPEYSHIQAFVPCDPSRIGDELAKVRRVLSHLGCDEDAIASWLTGIEWNVEEDGFVYTGCQADWMTVESDGSPSRFRPIVLGWTPQGFKVLDRAWLEFDLLYDTDSIFDYSSGQFKSGVEELIWRAIIITYGEVPDFGVYFTDECGDGRTWKSMMERSPISWTFDLAVIPHSLEQLFSPTKDGFLRYEKTDCIFFVRECSWPTLPQNKGEPSYD